MSHFTLQFEHLNCIYTVWHAFYLLVFRSCRLVTVKIVLPMIVYLCPLVGISAIHKLRKLLTCYWIVQLKLSVCFYCSGKMYTHINLSHCLFFSSSMSEIKLKAFCIISFSLYTRCAIIRRHKLRASTGKDVIFYKNSCKWVDGFSHDWIN